MTTSTGTVLLVTCHTSENSLCGHITERVVAALEARGASVVINDLYRLGFDPVPSDQEFATYFADNIPEDIRGLVADLRSARELIFILPIWMFAMPAILKGYFDRVWRPNVAFSFDGKNLQPLLTEITRMTVIVTHGRSEAETNETGDGTRVFFESSLPTLLPNLKTNKRFDFYRLDMPKDAEIDGQLFGISKHISE